MQVPARVEPWWAAIVVWGVVNAVNLLQAAGFLSRMRTGGTTVNHSLGYGIIALAPPALAALIAFVRAGAGWLHRLGPALFLVFILLMTVVDYARPVEFRSPMRHDILVPYLILFFGSILFMGLPMYRMNRRLWFITAATTTMLLVSMGAAMRRGMA